MMVQVNGEQAKKMTVRFLRLYAKGRSILNPKTLMCPCLLYSDPHCRRPWRRNCICYHTLERRSLESVYIIKHGICFLRPNASIRLVGSRFLVDQIILELNILFRRIWRCEILLLFAVITGMFFLYAHCTRLVSPLLLGEKDQRADSSGLLMK